MKALKQINIRQVSTLLLLMLFLTACGTNTNTTSNTFQSVDQPVESVGDFQVVISGGHDTDPRDNGRPVILIASALGVPPEVFREAFSHVQPAAAGTEPDPAQVKENKAALLRVLAPYGITNDLLDTASNYYRYNRSAGETWTQTPAVIEAVVENGVVTGFVITNPGSGYTTPPTITVTGSDISATAVLSFGRDFDTNGSIKEIVLNP